MNNHNGILVCLSRVSKALLKSVLLSSTLLLPAVVSAGSLPVSDQSVLGLEPPAFLGGIALVRTVPDEEARTAAVLPSTLFSIDNRESSESAKAAETGRDPIVTSSIHDSVFGSVAIPITNFPISSRWRPIMAKIEQCASADCLSTMGRLEMLLEFAGKQAFMDKLIAVNSGINSLVRYRRDSANYGAFDYWAEPGETLAAAAGDCEDFAILKMAALARVGVPLSSMSLVVLQDRSRNVFHAVLSVTTSRGIYILDNLSSRVMRDTDLAAYVPLYSLSKQRAWIHGSRNGARQPDLLASELRSVSPGEGPSQEAAIGSREAPALAGERMQVQPLN